MNVLRRIPVLLAVAPFVFAAIATLPAGAASIPSGEVVVGGTVIEPVYKDETGAIGYVSTPINAPLKANSRAWAPFYVPVYPVGSTVGTLQCQDVPVENCPTHGLGCRVRTGNAPPLDRPGGPWESEITSGSAAEVGHLP
jgi:hypothetical protein